MQIATQTQAQAFELDVNNIETLEDVKVILDGLGLVAQANAPKWNVLQKYFTTPYEQPTLSLGDK